MSVQSHMEQVQLVLYNAVYSLEEAHGFHNSHTTKSGDMSIMSSIMFYGRKQLTHNAGAQIELILDYNQKKKVWFVSKFRTSCVYEGSTGDLEVNIRIYSGGAFLAYWDKSLSRDLPNHWWTISCARDFFALCKAFDEASVLMGYAPVFLVPAYSQE